MKNENFYAEITVAISPQMAFAALCNVKGWWATNVSGDTNGLAQQFIVRFGKTFATIEVAEYLPHKRVVWEIKNSYLPLFSNPAVWDGTSIVLEVIDNGSITNVRFTHVGLTPEKECYTDCVKGWTYYVTESLKRLMIEGIGNPGTGIFSYVLSDGDKYEGLLYFKNDPLPDYAEGCLYVDVKSTIGENITAGYSIDNYCKSDFDPSILQGEYFMIVEDKLVRKDVSLEQSIAKALQIDNMGKDLFHKPKFKKMENNNFHRTINVNITPEEAMKKISQVNLWWAKDFKGSAEKAGDTFSVYFGSGQTFVDFQVIELIPNKKVTWKVIDCNLHWINDKKEWKNTEIVFELLGKENITQIDFTHVGLVPSVECYKDCEIGWDYHFTSSLAKFINEGNGTPE